jgi:hypothetical protein
LARSCISWVPNHATIFGPSIRASAERAAAARKEADRLACEAWNKRMLGYRGPAQPSPALGDALNAGYLKGGSVPAKSCYLRTLSEPTSGVAEGC